MKIKETTAIEGGKIHRVEPPCSCSPPQGVAEMQVLNVGDLYECDCGQWWKFTGFPMVTLRPDFWLFWLKTEKPQT